MLYIFYAKDCVVERDAAAGQPPGQSSHPAARAGPGRALGPALLDGWAGLAAGRRRHLFLLRNPLHRICTEYV